MTDSESLKTPPSDGSSTPLLLISVVLIAAFVAWFGISYHGHQIVPADAALEEVSAERGLNVLTQLLGNQDPHPAGSLQNDKVRSRLVQHLKKLGLETEEAPFVVQGISMTNVLATWAGDKSQRPLLLATHYDSVEAGPGAADAGSCVAALLETARAFIHDQQNGDSKQSIPTIHFLFTDGEEWVRGIGHGLNGAEFFIHNRPNLLEHDPFVLNFDARGATGPSLLYETSRGNLELMRYSLPALPRPVFTASSYVAVYDLLPNATDFTEFKSSGSEGLNFAFIDDAYRYHTPEDTIENLDARSVQHHANNAFTFLKHWIKNPVPNLTSNRNAVFFELFGQWIVCYPDSYAIWLALLIAGLQLAGTIRRVRMRRGVLRGSLLDGCVAIVVGMIGCVLAGWAISWAKDWVPRSSHGFGQWDVFLIAILWLSCWGSLWLSIRFLTERATTDSIWVIVWLTNAALAIATAVWIPGFSYIFFAVGIVPGILSITTIDRRLASVISAWAAAIILVPLAWQFGIAIGVRMAIPLSILYAGFLGPVYPVMKSQTPLRRSTKLASS